MSNNLRWHNAFASGLKNSYLGRILGNYHKLCINRKVMNSGIWKKNPLFWSCLCWEERSRESVNDRLSFKPHLSKLVFMRVLWPDPIGIRSCWFLWWKETLPGEKTLEQDEKKQQTQPAYDAGYGNRTRVTLVEGECPHYCSNSACTRPWFTTADMTRNKVLYLFDLCRCRTLIAYSLPINELSYRDCTAEG